MKKYVLAAAVFIGLTILSGIAYAANNYPVVLVHGFAGFGRDEALGYKYWGGFTDLQEYLKSQGHPAYTAAVGPFSSNWDRAVELYYQIKGGCVDYGENHSAAYGHARSVEDKCYPGFYPQWDANHPIHIISHSMGGQTSRMLIQLLEHGYEGENNTPNESPLFTGGHTGWVKSLTTISTPNNGTDLALVVDDFVPLAQQLISGIAGLAGIADENNMVYNFKMEQWGLKRYEGECFLSYQDRVFSSPIWRTTRDISKWSLSPDGAAEENAWVRTSPNVYYFSYATKATYTDWFTGWEFPRIDMNAMLVPFAYPWAWPLPPGMGNLTRNEPGHVVIDESWWKNDGVVNTISMRNPRGQPAVDYTGAPQKGTWNYLGLMDTFDHFDIIGWTLFWDSKPFYLDLVRFLDTL